MENAAIARTKFLEELNPGTQHHITGAIEKGHLHGYQPCQLKRLDIH